MAKLNKLRQKLEKEQHYVALLVNAKVNNSNILYDTLNAMKLNNIVQNGKQYLKLKHKFLNDIKYNHALFYYKTIQNCVAKLLQSKYSSIIILFQQIHTDYYKYNINNNMSFISRYDNNISFEQILLNSNMIHVLFIKIDSNHFNKYLSDFIIIDDFLNENLNEYCKDILNMERKQYQNEILNITLPKSVKYRQNTYATFEIVNFPKKHYRNTDTTKFDILPQNYKKTYLENINEINESNYIEKIYHYTPLKLISVKDLNNHSLKHNLLINNIANELLFDNGMVTVSNIVTKEQSNTIHNQSQNYYKGTKIFLIAK